jgi:spermidine synthase
MTLTHPNIQNGWFRETCTMWPGQQMSLAVTEILHVETSKYQDVLVFQSETYGNVLVLDGVIQATERDEFAYQEMIAHIPLMSHPNPRHVLVIGGGDGGVLREIVKHESIESVTLVEIDESVVRLSRKYLPAMAAGFLHPKVTVIITDGFAYLQQHQGLYDVIITDSSDPVGPAESLFTDEFFKLLKGGVREGGVVCTQGECMWLHLPLIKKVMDDVRGVFGRVEYAYCSIPTYPSGTIGFLVMGGDGEGEGFGKAKRGFEKEVERAKCRYYNRQVHAAAFVLPQFVRNVLDQ